MFIIKCTNKFGDELYVCSTRSTNRLRFNVKVLKYAKKFTSKATAEDAITTFRPSVVGTRFEVVSI